MTELTKDTFFNGRLIVNQSASGYRFSIDSVILANLAVVKRGQRVLDLGTGCGIIPLIMAWRNPDAGPIYGVEIQAELADTAAENVRQNRMESRITIRCTDMKTLAPEATDGPFDAVVCNPPHYKNNSGRINPDTQRAIARHEITVTLDDMAATAQRMLCRAGRLILIYPAERLVDLACAMRNAGIEPKRLRFIHSTAGTEAKRVFVEGIAGKRPGAKIAAPLNIYDAAGHYTPETAAMFEA